MLSVEHMKKSKSSLVNLQKEPMRKKGLALHLVVGIPASGKTTYINSQMQMKDGISRFAIHRDEVRFSIIKDDEDYFSKEKAVFREFVRQVQDAIDANYDSVYIDATHISAPSRAKILKRLDFSKKNVSLFVDVFECNIEVAKERNSTRAERARVPDSAILNMNRTFTRPVVEEFFGYDLCHVLIQHIKEEEKNEVLGNV